MLSNRQAWAELSWRRGFAEVQESLVALFRAVHTLCTNFGNEKPRSGGAFRMRFGQALASLFWYEARRAHRPSSFNAQQYIPALFAGIRVGIPTRCPGRKRRQTCTFGAHPPYGQLLLLSSGVSRTGAVLLKSPPNAVKFTALAKRFGNRNYDFVVCPAGIRRPSSE